MTPALQMLLELMDLERIEVNLFRGKSVDLGWGRIYGGQVLGQALCAAGQTVPEDRILHSLHSYFLRPGDPEKPVVFDVDRIRDGRSFTTRRVVALQNGEAILNLAASFQKNFAGFEHQQPMPQVPEPEALKTDTEHLQEMLDANPDKLPKKLAAGLRAPWPFEFRTVNPVNAIVPQKSEARHLSWFRASGEVPNQGVLHSALLAWASDYNFLATALRPHGVSWLSPSIEILSLDHAIWFHRPIKVDDWHLYVVHSPIAAGTRALVNGSVYRQDGVHVASVIQEGIMRERIPKNKVSPK